MNSMIYCRKRFSNSANQIVRLYGVIHTELLGFLAVEMPGFEAYHDIRQTRFCLRPALNQIWLSRRLLSTAEAYILQSQTLDESVNKKCKNQEM